MWHLSLLCELCLCRVLPGSVVCDVQHDEGGALGGPVVGDLGHGRPVPVEGEGVDIQQSLAVGGSTPHVQGGHTEGQVTRLDNYSIQPCNLKEETIIFYKQFQQTEERWAADYH